MKKPPTDAEKERAYKDLYDQVTMLSMGRETTIGTRLEMARYELAEKRNMELERVTAIQDEPCFTTRGVENDFERDSQLHQSMTAFSTERQSFHDHKNR